MRNSLVLLAVAAVAFAAGYGVARSTAPVGPVQEELAAIRGELAAMRPQAAAPVRRGIDPDKVHDVAVGSSPVRGTKDARVTIVEFSDFQCPYCSRVGPTLDKLLEDYAGKLRVVYKHFPLSFHERAEPAARAAVAAGRQGRFWEMHDLIFANQKSLSDADFVAHAQKLGLDTARFQKDYASPEVAAEVAADVAQARQLGVTGTPGFFVNGRFLSGAQPYEEFKVRVDAELVKRS